MNKTACPTVYIYDGVGAEWLDTDAVKEYVERWLSWTNVVIRDDLVKYTDEPLDTLAEQFSKLRVRHPSKQVVLNRILKPELDYEMRVLTGRSSATAGVVYDGFELQRAVYGMMSLEERPFDAVSIWLTERAIATWDENDRRFHARASVYGHPSIISTTGMVIAPARERAYYISRRFGIGGEPKTSLDDGQHLEFRSPAITECVKGYVMQAVMFALTGEPFCEDAGCRLFNAHWQREMMAAQFGGDSDFCPRHEHIFDVWNQHGQCTFYDM